MSILMAKNDDLSLRSAQVMNSLNQGMELKLRRP